jgi:hypothetical protein
MKKGVTKQMEIHSNANNAQFKANLAPHLGLAFVVQLAVNLSLS